MLTADRFVRSGKVRDLYELDGGRVLMVASDRISAFDVVLPTPIPDKGRVLTGLSRFWFGETESIVPNHLVGTSVDELPEDLLDRRFTNGHHVSSHGMDKRPIDQLRGRVMVCRRASVLPIEIVVRGYLSGSGWKDYRAGGSICGVKLPAGLRESERLPEPILTPATKAEQGEHDLNIDLESMVQILADWAPNGNGWLGPQRARAIADEARDVALRLYAAGAERCESAGLVLADTKFEMGLIDGELTLVDEVLTPDSSRFWDAAAYAPGGPQASFDKQFVRDWLERQPWDKTAPGPELPDEVVEGTRTRYVEAFERITSASFERYLRDDVIGPATGGSAGAMG